MVVGVRFIENLRDDTSTENIRFAIFSKAGLVDSGPLCRLTFDATMRDDTNQISGDMEST